MRIILITGISGSGKSVALNVLEDAGYYCVDNLPAQFIPELACYLADQGYSQLGVATDIRSRESLARLPDTVRELAANHQVQVLYLTASTDALVQRYSETRRRHPLSASRSWHGRWHAQRYLADRGHRDGAELLSPLAESAHRIDTSNVRTNTLRSWIKELIQDENDSQPAHAAVRVVRVQARRAQRRRSRLRRALPAEPYYDLALRPLTGRDAPVIDFLQSQPMVLAMAEDIRAYVEKWLPSFIADNRSYLTVAIGCTGGQHRSVFIAERLANYFRAHGNVLVRHRELAPLADARRPPFSHDWSRPTACRPFFPAPHPIPLPWMRCRCSPCTRSCFQTAVCLSVYSRNATSTWCAIVRDHLPFGVCLIATGEVAQPGQTTEPESIGCLAEIVDCNVEQLGVLLIETRGRQRFRVLSRHAR
jgi:UPF0042 nucleotide-binding protein